MSKIQTIQINIQPKYNIHIGEGLLKSQKLINACKELSNRFVIITDDVVNELYAQVLKAHLEKHGISTHIIFIKSGEQYKTRETKAFIEDKLCGLSCGRDTAIIALGGGVITDLAGFVAATFCRGIPVIYCPTTLLAMVDACIGGKTAVNTPYGKNLIGTFTQPKAVFSDVDTLITLPNEEYVNGLVEAIKHGLIADADFFDVLYNSSDEINKRSKDVIIKLIVDSCNIKKKIVETDEKENGLRALLNFGHTIGHALETASEYAISHGKSVSIGIIIESYLSMQMVFLSKEEFEKIEHVFLKLDISTGLKNKEFCAEEVKKAMMLDKKARNKTPRFVLLNKIGMPHSSPDGFTSVVNEDTLDQALSKISS